MENQDNIQTANQSNDQEKTSKCINIKRISGVNGYRYVTEELSQVNLKRITEIVKPHCVDVQKDTKTGVLKFMFVNRFHILLCIEREKLVTEKVKEELGIEISFSESEA
jgi:hypothetical protein